MILKDRPVVLAQMLTIDTELTVVRGGDHVCTIVIAAPVDHAMYVHSVQAVQDNGPHEI